MSATAADYAWFEDRPAALSQAYCLTLARGLTPAEFLARISARPEQARTGVDALFEPSMGMDEQLGDVRFIGVTTVTGEGADWALGIEVNGFLGVTEEVIVPLSAGTAVVSHYRNVNALDHFYWIEDRDIRLDFEPLFASDRRGSASDAVMDAMREAGFDLLDDGETEEPTAAAFALAERLTGVRVTAELLEEAAYACGIVPDPSRG